MEDLDDMHLNFGRRATMKMRDHENDVEDLDNNDVQEFWKARKEFPQNAKSVEQKEKKEKTVHAIQVPKVDPLNLNLNPSSKKLLQQMRNLSDLPYELLFEIATRLEKLEHFTSFRCVSRSLRASVKKEDFKGLWLRQKIPYLMLPVRDDNDDDIRELYSLVDGESTVASFKVNKFKNKKCLESLGWLLASEEDGSMSLLDPFSGIEIPLPHQNTFPGYEEYYVMDAHVFMQKMVLSSRPDENFDFILFVICGGYGHLAFWRPGDIAWNMIETRPGRFVDVVYYGDGLVYAICFPGIVYAFNLAVNVHNHLEDRIITRCEPLAAGISRARNLYISKMVVGDSLLIIKRTSEDLSEDGCSYTTTKFQVYEVDMTTNTWKEIHSLGTMAVFLGQNSTCTVDASTFSRQVIKANHIYFTDDDWEFYYYQGPKGGGMDIGVYNLETGAIEPIYPGEPLFSKVSPSFWITPCF